MLMAQVSKSFPFQDWQKNEHWGVLRYYSLELYLDKIEDIFY